MANKYKYHLKNGKFLTLEGDSPPSDEEVESIAKEQKVELQPIETTDESTIKKPSKFEPKVDTGPEEKGWLSKAWNTISEPLTDAPSRFAKSISEYIDPEQGTSGPRAIASVGIESLGNVISGLSSPLNLATAAMSGGTSLAAKAGLPAIARGLNLGTKLAGAGMTAHGAEQIYSGETTPEKLLGGLEMAGGVMGMRSKVPSIGKSVSGETRLPTSEGNIKFSTKAEMDAARPAFNAKEFGDAEIVRQQKIEEGLNPARPNELGAGKQPPVERPYLANEKLPDLMSEKGAATIGPKANKIPMGQTILIKSGKSTPEAIKKAKSQGFEFQGLNDQGDFRFKKVTEPTVQPILESEVPAPSKKVSPVEEKISKTREAYELSRALMSVDLPFSTSAAFRQALPMMGTKNWFKAWYTAARSYGSETFYDATMQRINEHPLFKPRTRTDISKITGKPIIDKVTGKPKIIESPSFAQEIGLRTTDLGKLSSREEFIRSQLAERIPFYGKHVAGSNRAYTAFLNDLRANTLDSLIKDAQALNKADSAGGIFSIGKTTTDPLKDLTLARGIAEFINDATGRGSLKTSVGIGSKFSKEINLEHSSKILSDTLFSPRLMASRIRMLNPQTYIMANPFVRKQYLYGMLRAVGGWWTMASLGEMAGAKISKDPNNADFGKIRIGNTRIDPGGGFQQFLVLGNRMLPKEAGGGGITSSVSGRFNEFGKGYKPETRLSTGMEFGMNKLHPVLKFATDIARASERRPVQLGDRTLQLFIPIIAGDIMEIIKKDPSLLPLVGLASTTGMGTQTYEGGISDPNFIPKQFDITLGGQ